MRTAHIDIGRDFSKTTSGRYRKDALHSGEEFLEKILLPAYRNSDLVVVALDSLEGFSASFFEEAFGGLVRREGAVVLGRIKFDAVDRAYLVPQIQTWMKEA
jgi:hypothetical protein